MAFCPPITTFSHDSFLVKLPPTDTPPLYMPSSKEENVIKKSESYKQKLPAIKDGTTSKFKKSSKTKKTKNKMSQNRAPRFVPAEETNTHPVNFIWHNKVTLSELRAETRRVEAEAAEAAANLLRFEQQPKYVEVRRPETPKHEKNFILENKLSVKTTSLEKKRQEEEEKKKEEERKKEAEKKRESKEKKKTSKPKTKQSTNNNSLADTSSFNEDDIRCVSLAREMEYEMDSAERRKPRKKQQKQKRNLLLLQQQQQHQSRMGCGGSSNSLTSLASDLHHSRYAGGEVKGSASDEFMEVWNRGEQKMADRRRKARAAKRRKANINRLSSASTSASAGATVAAGRRRKKNGDANDEPNHRQNNSSANNDSIHVGAAYDSAFGPSDMTSALRAMTSTRASEPPSAISSVLSEVRSQESRRAVRRLVSGVVEVLESHDTNHRARVLVRDGGTKVFLDALVFTGRENPYDYQHLLKLHRLLMLLAPRDARFGVKARNSGAIDVTMTMLKNFVTCMNALPTLLRVMRFYVLNKGNASRVGKSGGIACMLRIIKHCGKRHQLVQKLALNALTGMCQPANQEAFFLGCAGIGDLLKSFVMWFTNDTGMREKTIEIREGILEVLSEMIKNKTGRKMFVDSRGPQILHRIALENMENPRLERVVAKSLEVIRKSLPNETVPVPGHNGPFNFGIPNQVVDESSSDSAGSDDDDDDVKDRCEGPSLSCATSSKMDKSEIFAKFSRFFPEETLMPAANRGAKLDHRRTGTFTTTSSSSSTGYFNAVDLDSSTSTSGVGSETKTTTDVDGEAAYAEYSGPAKTVMPVSKTAHPFWGKMATSWRGSEPLRYTSTTKRLERMLEALKDRFDAMFGVDQAEDIRNKIVYDEDSKVAQMKCKDSMAALLHPPAEWGAGVGRAGGGGVRGGAGGGVGAVDKKSEDNDSVSGSASNNGEVSANGRVTSVSGVTGNVRVSRMDGGEEFRSSTTTTMPLPKTTTTTTIDAVEDGSSLKGEEQEAKLMTCTNSDEGRIGKSHGHSLKFDSRFECGNLRRVIQVGDRDYNLILRNDINTNSHHQWFYFEVSNIADLATYRFNIVNMQKCLSQFSYGMQPVMYSVEEAMVGRPCWRRVGDNVTYFRNTYFKGRRKRSDKFYFTLSFEIAFPYVGDICYIAFHFPYTHSAMMRWIRETEKSIDPKTVFYRRQSLCKTLGGNEVPLLTITANSTGDATSCANVGKRPYIVLSARVHPGETNSSWIMQGCMKMLMENSDEARALREKYIFKIIPMLNPDGVINGCHRTSLTGEDLNRRWLSPSPELHPTIYHAKGLFQFIHHVAKKRVKLFCDMHGHSLFKNIFLFGCSENQTWEGTGRKKEAVAYRQLPLILHDTAPAFSLRNSSFMVQKDRASTARVVVWKHFNVEMSYTLESTYSGMDRGPYEGLQLSTRHMEEMGEQLASSLRLLDGVAILSKFSTRSKTGFFKHSKLWQDREANPHENELTRHSKFMEGLRTYKGELARELRGEVVADDDEREGRGGGGGADAKTTTAAGSDDGSDDEEEEDEDDDQSGTDSDIGQSQDSDD